MWREGGGAECHNLEHNEYSLKKKSKHVTSQFGEPDWKEKREGNFGIRFHQFWVWLKDIQHNVGE